MSIKRGDIYWITSNPYRGTTGHVQKPGRPGIIVSNNDNNAFALTFEIVYLTSKPKKEMPTHCAIDSTGKPSIALCEQVQTVSDEQIRERIGHCTAEELSQIDRCLAISLGIQAPNDEKEEQTYCTDEDREELRDTISQLEGDLAVATAKLELMQEMYDRLLQSTIR